MQIFDADGQRKYLTPGERQDFITAAQDAAPAVRTFCETLALSGCRLSEALRLTSNRVDLGARVLVFESLKKRRRGIFRAVPVPTDFLQRLDIAHDLQAGPVRLWPWSRTTGWRRVKEVMEAADITGAWAVPKALRHGFAVKAVTSEIPVTMTQRWLGHSRLETTAIYLNVSGPEEHKIAERLWR